MSSLYIRVRTGFYTHKKTIRLKLRLGMDALWIPPRLWAWAAESQPDGNLSGYSSDEIAELIGFSGNAKCNTQAMLQALKDSGFVDESGIIHDWREHNGYHETFSIRAKKAAEARWSKEKTPTPPKEETGKGKGKGEKQCLDDACSITPESIYEAYPLKVGKPFALKAIQKAMLKTDPKKLLELTEAYSKLRNGDKSFVPHPSTWFNQERYNDDPKTWVRIESPAASQTEPQHAFVDGRY